VVTVVGGLRCGENTRTEKVKNGEEDGKRIEECVTGDRSEG